MSHKKFNEDLRTLYEIGFDLIEGRYELVSSINKLFKATILSHYTQEGFDWVEWFIYESDYGQKDWSESPSYRINEDGKSELIHEKGEVRFGAYDEDGNPICYSYKSLWEYLEQNHLKQ